MIPDKLAYRMSKWGYPIHEEVRIKHNINQNRRQAFNKIVNKGRKR